VAYLLGAINATDSSEDKSQLFGLLALEYGKFKVYEKELEALQAAIKLCPDDPMLHTQFSSSYLHRGQYEEARQMAEAAVSAAEVTGLFRRHSLQTLARALTSLRQFGELEKVVEKLIQMKDTGPDTAIETDFLVALPPDSFREELRQQYLSLKESRSRR
jgi:tetratricopeptide (TPR) repeat protein